MMKKVIEFKLNLQVLQVKAKQKLKQKHTWFLIILGCLGSMSFLGCSNNSSHFSIPSTNQTFDQTVTYNNKVDILFIIDNSKSMLQYQQKLSARIPEMIQTLNTLKMDYQVAVTTTTMALNSNYPMSRKLVGSPEYLTSSNIQLLTERLVAGESGSDNERGLDSLYYMTSTYAPSYVPGFLRKDALFVTIILADENDNSSEFGNGDQNDFVNYMNSFKPAFPEGGRAWIAHYIGNLQNQSCDVLGGYVSVGTKYMRLVEASGGINSSLCEADLAKAVSNIKSRIIDVVTAYHLKNSPDKASIVVTVAGNRIQESAVNGWTLEQEIIGSKVEYFIKFHGTAIPAADQKVIVDFTPAGAA